MPNIIYLEDDELVGQVAKDVLATAGYQLHVFGHGIRGLEAISIGNPDLVILDFNLPGMNGLQVLRHLRQVIATRHTPVLILTVRRDASFIDEVMSAGANSFMAKPFSPIELIARVEALIDG